MEFLEKETEIKNLEIFLTHKNFNINETGILNLAFLGDSVWELFIRNYFFSLNLGLNDFNKLVKKYVNAKKQSEIFLKIIPELNKEEELICRRARNAKTKNTPKNCNLVEYKNATSLEALIAYYFINKQFDRINNLLKKYIEGDMNEI